VTILVPFLVFCISFTWDVSTMGGGLPAWLDGAWCCWRSVLVSLSSPWSACNSMDPSVAKNFRVGTSGFDRNWGSLTPMVEVVDFLVALSASSVGFRLHLLSSRNSSMDGSAVIVVSAVSFSAALYFRTAIKSYTTSVYTPYGSYTAAFLSEASGDSSWCTPCFGRLESISDFRRLTQGYIPLARQCDE
jgi:hypothetical protein